MRVSGIPRQFPTGPLIGDIEEICDATTCRETIVSVRSASVVLANYDLILHDFRDCFGPKFKREYSQHFCERCHASGQICRGAIDNWIVKNAAYLSEEQIKHTIVNSNVDYIQGGYTGYRPPKYGRALVVPVRDAASGAKFLDIKGAGVAPNIVPHHLDDHGHPAHGLEYLGVAIGDFIYAWIIDRIFRRVAPAYATVPVYAVLDLGFDIVKGQFGTAPAGMHVRRAHARVNGGLDAPMSGSDEEKLHIHIESILRAHGLTTASVSIRLRRDGEELKVIRADKILEDLTEKERLKARQLWDVIGEKQLRLANIQLTKGSTWSPRHAQMFDFGHVSATHRKFGRAVANRAADGVFEIGRIAHPGDPTFIEPIQGIAVDGELFNREMVNALSFDLARGYRSGFYPRKKVSWMLKKAIRRASAQWAMS